MKPSTLYGALHFKDYINIRPESFCCQSRYVKRRVPRFTRHFGSVGPSEVPTCEVITPLGRSQMRDSCPVVSLNQRRCHRGRNVLLKRPARRVTTRKLTMLPLAATARPATEYSRIVARVTHAIPESDYHSILSCLR